MKILFLILTVLLLTSSCTTWNRTKNVHFLGVDEKGELAVSGATDLNIRKNNPYINNAYKNLQFQAAYSPIKHLVISTSNSLAIPNSFRSFQYKNYDLDIGLGTYKRFRQKSIQDGFEYFTFDAYLTYGHQRSKTEYLDTFGERIMHYNKYALQLGIHYQSYDESKNMVSKIGFVYKPTLVEYSRLLLIGDASLTNNDFEDLRNDNTSFDNEIAIRLEFGTPKFRVFINHGNRIDEIRERGFGFDDKNFQLGFVLNFNDLIKKEKD